MSTTTPPPVYTVSNIRVQIQDIASPGDMGTLLFSSCSPPDWSIDAPKHIFHGNTGPESIISTIQNPTYGTMTLTQGWDQGNILAKWKAIIEDPSQTIDQKKKDVKVDFLQSDGQTILFSWHTATGLLTGYTHAASDASSNAVLTVSATIDGDTWEQLDSGGSPITGS
jgi:T4-like virus tail tube protein gp19